MKYEMSLTEKKRQYFGEYYVKNLERMRERNRINAKRQYQKKREEINARKRKMYHEDKESAAKQKRRRIKRKPHLGVERAIQLYERGDLGIISLTQLLRERLALSIANEHPALGFGSDSGRKYSGKYAKNS